jgi:hypothetical protein
MFLSLLITESLPPTLALVLLLVCGVALLRMRRRVPRHDLVGRWRPGRPGGVGEIVFLPNGRLRIAGADAQYEVAGGNRLWIRRDGRRFDAHYRVAPPYLTLATPAADGSWQTEIYVQVVSRRRAEPNRRRTSRAGRRRRTGTRGA